MIWADIVKSNSIGTIYFIKLYLKGVFCFEIGKLLYLVYDKRQKYDR